MSRATVKKTFHTLAGVLPHFQMDAIRYEEFNKDVLAPLAHPITQRLSVEIAHFQVRVGHSQAIRGKTRSVEIGHRWGPILSTAWFRLRGAVPKSFRGQRTLLRFSSGTEACLYIDGVPHAGFDPYHDTAAVIPTDWRSLARARGGEKIDLWIEAACNLPLGATTFWWDQPEVRARWKESKPGRLESAELIVIDEEVWQFTQRFDWLRRMLWDGAPESARTNDINHALAQIVRAIPAGGATRDTVLAQRDALDEVLRGNGRSGDGRDSSGRSSATCVAIGHAHIDTAWLWRIDETRRKCVRSFATALRNIERFDHFRFLCSQAQQYQFVKEESPALFKEITAAVKAGRWEPNGAMWIEPDCTAPSGESFIRQIVHGTRWWSDHFGAAAQQRFLYLPDTFGFPACLPQIIAKAGLDTFITNKMIWSDTNRFPHVTFNWRGLDGTEVLTHFTPGHNYNSDFVPKDLVAAQANIETQDKGRTRTYLQPYGWGDGGGGPDAMQIERTMNANACEGVPTTTHEKAGDFCGILHTEARDSARRGAPLPVWDGELYLEAHRGTYTSQRWIKQANRSAEKLLRHVEMLAVLAPLARAKERALLVELDALWKQTLLHQFHDILPGSSIGAVYDDARAAMGGVIARLTTLRDEGVARGGGVFNPASVASGGVAGCTIASADARGPANDPALAPRATTKELSNGIIVVRLNSRGSIQEIVTADGRHQPSRGRVFNELVLYEDRPRRWEAWDTDKEYLEKPTAVMTPCVMKASSRAGVAMVTVERALGSASSIVQTYELSANSDVVIVRTRLEWREERTLLRALFPTRVRARSARFGTQFGHIDRDTHRNTSWQCAQFEVPGHDWMRVTDGAQTFAVIDDGIFGKSALGGELGLTLTKSSNFPDPHADRGVHEFSYAIRCHAAPGASEFTAADRLNNSVIEVSAKQRKQREAIGQFVEVLGGSRGAGPAHNVEISAMKPADDGSGDVVIRLVERSGAPQACVLRWSLQRAATPAVTAATHCDFFEKPLRGGAIAVANNRSRLELAPFEIVSVRVKKG